MEKNQCSAPFVACKCGLGSRLYLLKCYNNTLKEGWCRVHGAIDDRNACTPRRRVAGFDILSRDPEVCAEPQVHVGQDARFEGGGALALREKLVWRGAAVEAEGGGGGSGEDVERSA